MKKILIPCDFSDQAVEAFRLALDLAAMVKGEIHLVNVIELPVMHDTVLMPTLSFEENLIKELKAGAEIQFEKIKSQYGGSSIKIESVVLYGATSISILDYVTENNIDLVVMVSKGASGVKEFVIGSNAEKIVRRSAVPVLVVKKHIELSSIKNIVFPSTLQHDHEDLVTKVKELQDLFKATLHIVYINTPGNFTRDIITTKRLDDFAKRYMFTNYTINVFNDSYEESGVINFTHTIGADMIAMGTHGRKGLTHILSGSVTEDVVNHVDCPIWTFTFKD
jgi:nucleotide-binding universal stress UspA family protein